MFGGFNFNPFDAMFGGPGPITGNQQQQPPRPDVPPPASNRALQTLPMVNVTADDLIEEANKECAVCLEEQKIGTLCCKLPCGHLYHKACLIEWLHKHCTCPVCRYEIETDDASYETKRVLKMQDRKLRYRRDELEAKSIHALRQLMVSLHVSSAGCIDKSELVDRLVHSGKIMITEGVGNIEMTQAQLNAQSVAQLRHMLNDFGISQAGAIEKFELRDRLVASGRVVIIEESEMETVPEETAAVDTSQVALEEVLPPPPQRQSDRFQIHEETLRDLSIRELLEIMTAFDISTESCVERDEMLRRIRDSPRIDYISG